MGKALVVNLLAGSGAGKSTNAARLFSMLKDEGVEVELVTEYAKELVWEKQFKTLACQPYIFGHQLWRIMRVEDHVEVIINDSPLVLSVLYDPDQDPDLRRYIFRKFGEYDNLNFFIHRVKPFSPNGRIEKTEAEAVEKDIQLRKFLDDHKVHCYDIPADETGCEVMLHTVLQRLNKDERLVPEGGNPLMPKQLEVPQAVKRLAWGDSFTDFQNKQRKGFGKHKGHYCWDLARDWLCMSNDMFFERYGFNYVPRGELFELARDFVHKAAAQGMAKNITGPSAVTITSDIAENMLRFHHPGTLNMRRS